jgi:hypothetical protein
VIREEQELSAQFVMESESESLLNNIGVEILCYRGPREDPRWMDEEPGMSFSSVFYFVKFYEVCVTDRFSTLCRINADTSGVKKEPKDGPNGSFYRQHINVVLSCGLTQMKAQISWVDPDVSTMVSYDEQGLNYQTSY